MGVIMIIVGIIIFGGLFAILNYIDDHYPDKRTRAGCFILVIIIGLVLCALLAYLHEVL